MSGHVDHNADGGGHEHSDVAARPILFGGIVIVGLLLVSFVIVKLTFTEYSAHELTLSPAENPLAAAYGRNSPPDPQLQVDPLKDLARLRAAETQLLNHYTWVDKASGVVRLPIERAIELVAERGLPARASTEATR
jgi:hypothetical protein